MPCVSMRPARSRPAPVPASRRTARSVAVSVILAPGLPNWCRHQLLVGARVNNMSGVTSRPQSAARRKPATERRAEITETAASIAVSEGLDKLTAKRVAETLGVFPGLVTHYFATADELVAAAFAHAATQEREDLFGRAGAAGLPRDQMRRLLAAWLHEDRDPVSLLWLDAWQASRRRPALKDEV